MPEFDRTSQIKKNTLYYTAGSLFYFFAQWLMTVIVVKVSGFRLAGMLSLAMSVTSAPAIAALFNIRSYQISDIKGQYSNRTYINSRYYTCLLALILCLALALVNRYDAEKIKIIMTYMLFKLVESFADVYIGIEQKNERLDLAGISQTIRGFSTIVLFYAAVRLTNNLVAANLSIAAVSLAFVMLIDRRFALKVSTKDNRERSETATTSIRLLWTCLPLAAVALLNNYSFVIPKLVLEKSHGETVLGIYNSIASPTVVIHLIAGTVFAPWVPPLSVLYFKKNKKEFDKTGFRIIRISLLLCAVCIGAVIILDLTGLLSFLLVSLYAEGIRSYAVWFLPVSISAILIAFNACLFSVCTLMRMVKSQIIIGIIGVIASYGFSYLLVPEQGIRGTIFALIATTLIQLLIQIIIVTVGYHRQFKESIDQQQ